MSKSELKQRKGDSVDNGKAAASEQASSKSPSQVQLELKNRYRWIGAKIVRLTMFVVACIVLSREDCGTAFGMKSGTNRVHVSPIGVLCNAAHHSEFLNSNFKFKSAAVKLLKVVSIPGEAYVQAKVDVFGEPSSLGKRQRADLKSRRKAGVVESAQKYVESCRTNTGMTKLTKGNIPLIAGSFLIVVGSLAGTLILAVGFPTVLTGMVAFVLGMQQVPEANGQVNSFFFGVIGVTCLLYFVSDRFYDYKVNDKKKKEAKAAAKKKDDDFNEWDDGYGPETTSKGCSSSCCG